MYSVLEMLAIPERGIMRLLQKIPRASNVFLIVIKQSGAIGNQQTNHVTSLEVTSELPEEPAKEPDVTGNISVTIGSCGCHQTREGMV